MTASGLRPRALDRPERPLAPLRRSPAWPHQPSAREIESDPTGIFWG